MSIKDKIQLAKPAQFFSEDVVDDYTKCYIQIYNQALDDAIEFFTEHIYDKTNKYIVRNYVCDRLEKMKK